MDKKRLFAVNFGRTYFKSAPLINPLGIAVGLAIPCLIVLAVMMFASPVHAGLLLAGTPVVPAVEIKGQIEGLQKQLGEFLEKAKGDIETNGRVAQETKAALEETRAELKKLQTQTDAIDLKLQEKHVALAPGKSVVDSLKENQALQDFCKHTHGTVKITLDEKQVKEIWERKDAVTITGNGVATSGVLPIDRTPGIVQEARQTLTMRNLLSARPTDKTSVDFVKVDTAMGYGSPQTEATAKFQNYVKFSTQQETIRTIATWIPASKQILDDMDELAAYIMQTLPYYVDLDEEIEILTGDGSGQHYHSLTHQASAFNTALLIAASGWNKIDILGRAIQQIQTAKEMPATFAVLNPADYWDMRLQKDSHGRYILGDPQEYGPAVQYGGTVAAPKPIFGLTPNVTNSMTSGYFLVGSGNPAAAELRDRQGMTVEISTSHDDFFVRNLVAIRAERRACLVVKRPGSYIYGALNTSP